MTRRRSLDEWTRIVAARKAGVGDVLPPVKRTRPREPEKVAALVELAVARMATKFPTLFEVVGERRVRLRASVPRASDARQGGADGNDTDRGGDQA